MITYTDEEIAQDWSDAMMSLPDRHDETIEQIRDRYQCETGYHEALHTAYILMENVESYLLDHAAVTLDEESFRLAHQAHTALFNLYQHLGELRFNFINSNLGEP
jgi:hypothetical protein